MLTGTAATPAPEQPTATSESLPKHIQTFLASSTFSDHMYVSHKTGGAGSVSEIIFVTLKTPEGKKREIAVKEILYEPTPTGKSVLAQHLATLRKLKAHSDDTRRKNETSTIIPVLGVETYGKAAGEATALVYAMEKAECSLADRISQMQLKLPEGETFSTDREAQQWKAYFNWVIMLSAELKGLNLKLGLSELHTGNVVLTQGGVYALCDVDSLLEGNTPSPDRDDEAHYLLEAVTGALRIPLESLTIANAAVAIPDTQPFYDIENAFRVYDHWRAELGPKISAAYRQNLLIPFEHIEPFTRRVLRARDALARVRNRCEACDTFYESEFVRAVSTVLDVSIRGRLLPSFRPFLGRQLSLILTAYNKAPLRFQGQVSLFDGLTYTAQHSAMEGDHYDVFDVYETLLNFFKGLNNPKLTERIILTEIKHHRNNTTDYRPLLILLRLALEARDTLRLTNFTDETFIDIFEKLDSKPALFGHHAEAFYAIMAMNHHLRSERCGLDEPLFELCARIPPGILQRCFSYDEMLKLRARLRKRILENPSRQFLVTSLLDLLALHDAWPKNSKQKTWLEHQQRQPSSQRYPLAVYSEFEPVGNRPIFPTYSHVVRPDGLFGVHTAAVIQFYVASRNGAAITRSFERYLDALESSMIEFIKQFEAKGSPPTECTRINIPRYHFPFCEERSPEPDAHSGTHSADNSIRISGNTSTLHGTPSPPHSESPPLSDGSHTPPPPDATPTRSILRYREEDSILRRQTP